MSENVRVFQQKVYRNESYRELNYLSNETKMICNAFDRI